MTDSATPATILPKRKPGRPRKIQPLESSSVPDSMTTVSTVPDIDAESLAMESGFGMARSVGESANDLTEDEKPADKEEVTENSEPEFFEVEEPARPDEPSVFPSGDIFPSYGDQDIQTESAVVESEASEEIKDLLIKEKEDDSDWDTACRANININEAYRRGQEARGETVLADGDLVIPLRVRELYVEALRDEAEVQGVSLRAHVQSLLDWWIENEFSAITAGR